MRSMTLLLVAGLALGCGGIGGYGGGGGGGVTAPPEGSGAVVNAVGERSWNPPTITVKAGDDVTFRNATGITHNVQFDQSTAGHPADVGDFVAALRSVRFATRGTFRYHCGIHPVMQGQVVVEP